MSRPHKNVKGFLLLAVAILLFDRLVFSIRNQGKSGSAVYKEDDNDIIRNSEPSDTHQVSAIAWNAFNPVIRAFAGKTNQSNVEARTKPFVLGTIFNWIQHVLALKKSRTSVVGTSPKSDETKLDVEIDKPARQNRNAYHNTHINGIDVAYHNPFAVKKVRGVALLIHGCGQEASDWFQLPEHRHIAAQLIRKRLALLAVTSGNRVTGCWSTRFPYWQNDDVERVTIATRQWIVDQGLPPTTLLHAVGISSGATMLSVLSSANLLPNLVSQALYISPGNQRAFRNATRMYPHTLFVHATTDHHYASPSAIASARHTLLKRDVGLVGELPLPRVHLTPLTLHEREPRITVETSRKVFAAAEAERGNIEQAMRVSMDEDMMSLWAKRESRRAVRQVIRVVNGFHEVCAVHADRVAEWLVSNRRRATPKTG